MSSLGLSSYEPLSPLEPEHPADTRSAARAFLISLVLPGVGQVYAKRKTAGWVTFAFFFFFLIGSIGNLAAKQVNAFGVMLFCAVSIYVYGFLDAYFSALEYNEGIASYMIGGNPRIACILNFLTNGIGYFYLGDRLKGILMFLGFVILKYTPALSATSHVWAAILWIVLQSALAFDAYRVARKRLLGSFPQLASHSWRAASTGQIAPILPVSVALVCILGFAGLCGLGLLSQSSQGIPSSADHVEVTPQGISYTNPDLGLKLLLPDGWQITPEAESASFYAERTSDGPDCRVILLREFSFFSSEHYQKVMEDGFGRRPGYSVFGHTHGTLGNIPAAMMQVGLGSVTEQVVTAKIGHATYTLLGVNATTENGCPTDIDRIRSSFRATR